MSTMTYATVGTLDLAPGDIVTRGVAGLSALRVTEIREPSHPAMPGLVVVGHYYVPGEMRWSDRESAINDADASARWTVHAADHWQLADERHVEGDGFAIFTYRDRLYVHQRMVQVSATTWTWPLSYQRADALARQYMPGARLASETTWGMTSGEKWRRMYSAEPTEGK